MPIADAEKTRDALRRDRLPDRRACETSSFEHAGADFIMSIGRYPDGRVGEVFIGAGHANSALDALASDAAIAISFALQHGADLAAIRAAMKRSASDRGIFHLISDGQTFDQRRPKDTTIVHALTARCAMQTGGRDAKSGATNAG